MTDTGKKFSFFHSFKYSLSKVVALEYEIGLSYGPF